MSLACPVCFLTFDGQKRCPRLFPCGHSTCQTCVCEMLKRSFSLIKCPECRAELELRGPFQDASPLRLDQLPRNVALVRIVEKLKQLKQSLPAGAATLSHIHMCTVTPPAGAQALTEHEASSAAAAPAGPSDAAPSPPTKAGPSSPDSDSDPKAASSNPDSSSPPPQCQDPTAALALGLLSSCLEGIRELFEEEALGGLGTLTPSEPSSPGTQRREEEVEREGRALLAQWRAVLARPRPHGQLSPEAALEWYADRDESLLGLLFRLHELQVRVAHLGVPALLSYPTLIALLVQTLALQSPAPGHEVVGGVLSALSSIVSEERDTLLGVLLQEEAAGPLVGTLQRLAEAAHQPRPLPSNRAGSPALPAPPSVVHPIPSRTSGLSQDFLLDMDGGLGPHAHGSASAASAPSGSGSGSLRPRSRSGTVHLSTPAQPPSSALTCAAYLLSQLAVLGDESRNAIAAAGGFRALDLVLKPTGPLSLGEISSSAVSYAAHTLGSVCQSSALLRAQVPVSSLLALQKMLTASSVQVKSAACYALQNVLQDFPSARRGGADRGSRAATSGASHGAGRSNSRAHAPPGYSPLQSSMDRELSLQGDASDTALELPPDPLESAASPLSATLSQGTASSSTSTAGSLRLSVQVASPAGGRPGGSSAPLEEEDGGDSPPPAVHMGAPLLSASSSANGASVGRPSPTRQLARAVLGWVKRVRRMGSSASVEVGRGRSPSRGMESSSAAMMAVAADEDDGGRGHAVSAGGSPSLGLHMRAGLGRLPVGHSVPGSPLPGSPLASASRYRAGSPPLGLGMTHSHSLPSVAASLDSPALSPIPRPSRHRLSSESDSLQAAPGIDAVRGSGVPTGPSASPIQLHAVPSAVPDAPLHSQQGSGGVPGSYRRDRRRTFRGDLLPLGLLQEAEGGGAPAHSSSSANPRISTAEQRPLMRTRQAAQRLRAEPPSDSEAGLSPRFKVHAISWEKTVRDLCALLQDRTLPLSCRESSAWSLGYLLKDQRTHQQLAFRAPGTVQELVQLIHESSEEGKTGATFCLACLGTHSKTFRTAILEAGAVPYLIEVVRCGSEYSKANAAWLLGALAGDSSFNKRIVQSMGALLPLVSASNDGGEDARRNAAYALRQIRSPSRTGLPGFSFGR